jgi:hypothetical protein
MPSTLLGDQYFDELAEEHRTWLSAFDSRYLANWERMLKANDESALAEAGVRRLLQGYGTRVEPNEDLTGGDKGAEPRPDFHCQSNGSSFDVEVTHISIEKATEATGITEDPPTFVCCSPLTGSVFWACIRKARQCARSRHPTLLAVATFHSRVFTPCSQKHDAEMLLTGETVLTFGIGQNAGEACETTYFRSAAFVQRDTSHKVGFARSSISALILCGLRPLWRDRDGVWGPLVTGILHPNPARPFDPAVLPRIEFGKVSIDRASRQLHVTWPNGNGDSLTRENAS